MHHTMHEADCMRSMRAKSSISFLYSNLGLIRLSTHVRMIFAAFSKASRLASLQKKHRNVTFLLLFNSRENGSNKSDSSLNCAARAHHHAHLKQARDKQTRVPSIHALPIQCKHYSITATKQGGAQGFRGGQRIKTRRYLCVMHSRP